MVQLAAVPLGKFSCGVMIIVSVTGFTNETLNLFTSHALRVSGEDKNKVVCA